MRALVCRAYGPPEALSIEERSDPAPAPGEALIAVAAAALNFPDVLMIQGKYQTQPPFPFTPGSEFSGTVAGLGAGVSGVRVGDRVFAACGVGAMATRVVVPAAALRPIPATMSFEQAAGISTTYGTSYHALVQRAALQPDETLLVLGAAGGVGLAAVEIGKALGARVIAAASSAEKLAVAKEAGADALIDYSDGELKEKVKALTGGRGADVIYDPVGGDLFDQCMRAVNWNGRVLVVGFTGGYIPKVPINLILLKGCQVVGVFYGSFAARDPATNAANFRHLLALYEAGRIRVRVGQTFPLADYAAAFRCLAERRAVGKVVLSMPT
jgi:NADPH2:quinone reductase